MLSSTQSSATTTTATSKVAIDHKEGVAKVHDVLYGATTGRIAFTSLTKAP